MALWFFKKVVWFVLATTLEGILLPSNMVAKSNFCFCLVKRLIVMLKCAVNVTTSSFQQFPLSLSAKFLFGNSLLFCLRWPTYRFLNAKSYNFHFSKNDVTWPLSTMAYSQARQFFFISFLLESVSADQNKIWWNIGTNVYFMEATSAPVIFTLFNV